MKERPILFSGPMVRAILEGRKTMTRRVIKPQPVEIADFSRNPPSLEQETGFYADYEDGESKIIHCPHGEPGDRLWVRESFYECIDNNDRVYYAATETPQDDDRRHYKKRPSIFLCRSWSRLTLEVVSVRAERLQDITEEDAKAEGAEAKRWGELKQIPISLLMRFGGNLPRDPHYVYGFAELWDSINAKRGYSWESNPLVWVVEFKRVEARKGRG